jgi:hypothetical protein
MRSDPFYAVAADTVLFIHALFIVFIVFGLVLIFAGKVLSWQWVRNPWLRIAHLLGIAVVVLQSWLGIVCPLTTWEMKLRAKALDTVYDGSFIAHWVGQLVYYQAPPWVFVLAYSSFGGLVLLSWHLVPPRRFGRHPGARSKRHRRS